MNLRLVNSDSGWALTVRINHFMAEAKNGLISPRTSDAPRSSLKFDSGPVWRKVLPVYLTVRITASILAWVGGTSIPNQPTLGVGDYAGTHFSRWFEIFFGLWERADSLWYVEIAKNGYGIPHDAAFMPLFPFLTRVVHTVSFLPWPVCALLVSNLAFLIGLGFVFRIARDLFDSETAERSIWYLALFPGSLFFLAGYTESLFLVLASGSWYFARRRSWFLAGILGGLLTLTRNFGCLIALPLLIELYPELNLLFRAKEFIRFFRNLLVFMIIPFALVCWLAYWHFKSGDSLAFVHQQGGWQRQGMLPWNTLVAGFRQAWDYSRGYPGGIYLIEAGAAAFGLLAALAAIWILPPSLTVLLWLGLLPALAAPYPGRMLMSYARFVSVLFPAFLVLAKLTRPSPLDQAVRVILAALFGLAVSLYAANQYMF